MRSSGTADPLTPRGGRPKRCFPAPCADPRIVAGRSLHSCLHPPEGLLPCASVPSRPFPEGFIRCGAPVHLGPETVAHRRFCSVGLPEGFFTFQWIAHRNIRSIALFLVQRPSASFVRHEPSRVSMLPPLPVGFAVFRLRRCRWLERDIRAIESPGQALFMNPQGYPPKTREIPRKS